MLKIWFYIKWFLIVIPLGIWATISAPILYPLAVLLRPFKNPLWIYLDDEILQNETNGDWKLYKQNAPKWWKHYQWHAFRNTMWNLKVYVKPKKGREHCKWNDEVIVDLKRDELYNRGKKLNINDKCLHMAGLKWIDKNGNEGWLVFSGVDPSYNYSIVGTAAYWYEVYGSLYYRYSTCRKISILGKDYWFNLAFGATDKRYLLNLKIYKYQELK